MEVAPTRESTAHTKWKILVIDDDEDDFVLIKEMLREAKGRKFDLQWASSYEKGQKALRAHHYKAVLVDYDLGQQTGIDLIREATARGNAVPLILFTGRGSYEVDVEAMQAGATLYLSKGEVNALLLERAIRYAIELKQKEVSLRASEAALQRSEERFNRAFNANPVPQMISRLESGVIEDINQSFAQLFGCQRQGLIGKTALECSLFANQADYARVFPQSQAEKTVRDYELDIQVKSGEIHRASLSTEVITIGNEPYLLTAVQDITERKRAEQVLRESEERFRALISASAQVFYSMSPDWSEMRNLDGGGLLANSEKPNNAWMEKYIHPEDQPWVQAVIDKAVQTGTTFELEHRVFQEDGSLGWYLSRAVPVRNAKGEIVEWFGTASDITKRKQAEEELRNAHERATWLARFPDENPNPTARVSDDGTILYHNRASADPRIWAFQLGEKIPSPFSALLEKANLQGERVEEEVQVGERFYTVTAMPFPDDHYVNLYGRDTTERRQAEEALREMAGLAATDRNRLATILDHLPVGVWIADHNGRMVQKNQQADRIWAGSAPLLERLDQYPQYDTWYVDREEKLQPEEYPFARVLATGQPFEPMEFRMRRFDGSEGYILVSATPILDGEGQLSGIVGINLDITKSKQAEEQLEFHASLLKNVHDAIIATDTEHQITAWNDAAIELYGYETHEVLGKIAGQILRSEMTSAQRAQIIQQLIETGRCTVETVQYTKDGRQIIVEGMVIPRRDSQGKVIGYITANRDITERKQSEVKLRESEQRYTALFNAKTNGIAHCRVITDGQGQPIDYEILQVNDAFESITGMKRADIEGRRAREVFPGIENFSFDYIGSYGRLALHGGELKEEAYFEATRQWHSIYAYSPKPGEFTTIFTDISARKETEQALQQNEMLLEAFFANSPGILNIVDADLRYIKSDPLTPTYFGLDRETIIGKALTELAPEFHKKFSPMMKRVMETGQTEQRMQVQSPVPGRLDKMTFWQASYFSVPLPGGKTGIGVMGVDVTEQKKAEMALMESEQRYTALFNAKTNSITHCRIITDGQGQPVDYEYLQVNEAYEAFVGMKWSEIVGRRAREVFPDIHNGPVDYIAIYGQVALQGGEVNFETFVAPWQKWLSIYAYSPQQGEFTSIFTDITERKRAEAEQQEQSIQIEVQRRLLDQREKDRIAVARDLHDGPIQTLSSTMFHLHLVKDLFPDPVLQTELDQLGSDIRNTIAELRSVMNDLRPPALITFGFSKVLQNYIDDLRARYPDRAFALDAAEDDTMLSDQTHLTLFRIFQAGINNILRHSDASQVGIVYTIDSDCFRLELNDNGRGFEMRNDFSRLAREGHFGLVGMRERAEAIGAEFFVTTEPGQGTKIIVKGKFNTKNLKERLA